MFGRLLNRHFVLFWQGQLVSQLGSQLGVIALTFWVADTTDSASLLGLLLTLTALPGVLLGPVGGTFADRHSRRSILIGANLLHAVVALCLAALLFLEVRQELLVALLVAAALVTGVGQGFFRPASGAAIPDLVPTQRLAAANSLFQAGLLLAVIVGQAVGGVLYGVLGAAFLFLMDGLSFLHACVSMTLMRLPQRFAERDDEPRHVLQEYARDTWEGFRYVWNRRGMRQLVLAFGVATFFAGPVVVLFPFFVKNSLGKGAEWYGFLMAAAGAGGVMGFLLISRLQLSPRTTSRVVTAAMLAACALVALTGQLTVPLHALAVLFVLGGLVAMIQIFVRTLVQATTPSEIRGRTIGLIATLSGGLAPLGTALGGVLGDLTGKNIPLIFGVSGAASALTILAAALSPAFWEFLATRPGEAGTLHPRGTGRSRNF